MTNTVFMPPEYPLMYRAIGQVHGRFIPSQKKITQGVFLTNDGLLLPARLIHQAGWMSKKCPEKVQIEEVWSAYPHTEIPRWFEKIQGSLPDDEVVQPAKNQPPPPLWLELRSLRRPKEEQTMDDILQGNNYFSIRGEIVQQNEEEGKLTVRIGRNKVPQGQEEDPFFQPSTIILDGFLPGNVVGQFWDLEVSREGETLIVENGSYVANLSPAEPEPTSQPPEQKQKGEKKSNKKVDKVSKTPPKPTPQPPEQKQKDEEKPNEKAEIESKTPPKKTGKIIRLVK